MKIVKETFGGQQVAVSPEELVQINQLSRKALAAEEIYTFAVRLCDNDVDRDGERFPQATLEQLAPLFVGKSGIFDHDWSAKGQAARIYRTELVREKDMVTAVGDGYYYLKGYAYMVRTKANEDLIAEIEGGIKKEVSVGCAVEKGLCSICGEEWNGGSCGHKKGQEYDGQLCFVSLEGATDAYEFSFVAVPAQPRAGVVKGKQIDLKALVKANPGCASQLERLEKEAGLGRSYLQRLRGEVVAMGRLADDSMEEKLLNAMVKGLDEGELLELKASFEGRAALRYPLKTQFPYEHEEVKPLSTDGAFLI